MHAIYRSMSSYRMLIKRTRLPTNIYQNHLPIIKVPGLEETLSRYLKSQEGLLSHEDYKLAMDITKKFAHNEGPLLQEKLEQYACTKINSNYVTEFWTDMYLEDRRSLVLNHQPFLLLEDSQVLGPAYNKQSTRASNLIYSILRFYNSLKSNQLDPEIVSHGLPLDMSQYGNFFKSTRIPKPFKDHLTLVDQPLDYVIIMNRGNFYKVNVITNENDLISPEELHRKVVSILARTESQMNETPLINILTGMPRTKAAELREKLTGISTVNADNFTVIDGALFLVALDNKVDESEEELETFAKDCLAGQIGNRWFDKSFTLIVNVNGRAGITFEHSWADGMPILRLLNEIYQDSEMRPFLIERRNETMQEDTVELLDWIINDQDVKNTLNKESLRYETETNDVDLQFVRLNNLLTRNLCKDKGLSADSMIQLAFQIAYAKLHNELPSTYESCSLAHFKQGRTETIRSLSTQTRDFITAYLTQGSNLINKLPNVSLHHKNLVMEASKGLGWDRHLFMLREILRRGHTQVGVCDFFENNPYLTRINRIDLSTSSLCSKYCKSLGFAPSIPSGYGIGYQVHMDYASAMISSWKSSPISDGLKYSEVLMETIYDLTELIKKS